MRRSNSIGASTTKKEPELTSLHFGIGKKKPKRSQKFILAFSSACKNLELQKPQQQISYETTMNVLCKTKKQEK